MSEDISKDNTETLQLVGVLSVVHTCLQDRPDRTEFSCSCIKLPKVLGVFTEMSAYYFTLGIQSSEEVGIEFCDPLLWLS